MVNLLCWKNGWDIKERCWHINWWDKPKYINAHCRTSERARMGNYNVLGKIKEACEISYCAIPQRCRRCWGSRKHERCMQQISYAI